MTFEQWALKNKGLIMRVALEFRAGLRVGEDFDDVLQAAMIGAWEGYRDHRPDRGAKLSTFVYRVARNHCISHMEGLRCDKRKVTLTDQMSLKHSSIPDYRMGGGWESTTNAGLDIKAAFEAIPDEIERAVCYQYFSINARKGGKSKTGGLQSIGDRYGLTVGKVRGILKTWRPRLQRRLAAYKGA